MKVTIDGDIIRKGRMVDGDSFFPSGFDFYNRDNVLITGNGRLSDDLLLSKYTDDNFLIMKWNTGYTPFIHVRSCRNVIVEKIKLYKVSFGIVVSRCDRAYYTNWDLVGTDIYPTNCIVRNVSVKYSAFLGITLNSARQSSIENCYVHRSGDGGLHIQFFNLCNMSSDACFKGPGIF